MFHFMQFIRQFTVWLHYPLFEYGLFYIDLWSLVHFWSGLMVFIGLTVLGWKNRWGWLAFFLTAFEVIEATIFISVMKMFMPEKLPDSFTDIFIGMAGGYLIYFLFEKQKITNFYSQFFIFSLTSVVVSFLWTGNYGYLFREISSDLPAMNWPIFWMWVLGGILVLYLYSRLRSRNYSILKAISLTWITYLAPVLILMSCNANIFSTSETTPQNQSALLKFLSAEGTLTFFYLTSPFFFILLYILLATLFNEYTLKRVKNENN